MTMENVQSQQQAVLTRTSELVSEQISRLMNFYSEAATSQWNGLQSATREMNAAASNAMKYGTEVAEVMTKFQMDMWKTMTSSKASSK
jgi:hypothetical protein